MGRFDDRATQPSRGPADILRWRLDKLRGVGAAQVKDEITGAPSRPNDGTTIHQLPASITWVGHATFALRLGGQMIAVDPIWSERIQGVVKRLVPPGVALEDIPRVETVLVSHNHFDHLDLPTLQRIGPTARYLVPLGNGALLRDAGLTDVVELDWWQSRRVGEVEYTLVPARHWSMRMPWTRNEMLWGGWVIRAPEGTAYHSGDTGYFDDFVDIGRRCGPIDCAMLPIGAYEPRWFMEPQHMNPDDAVAAFEALGARTFVAMHWGTFKLTDEALHLPVARARELWAEKGLDPARLWVMDVGETRAL